MALAILHLSDIHLRTGSDSNPVLARSEKIAAALGSVAPRANTCCIAITGDIAFSGQADEYRIATDFLDGLQTDILKHIPNCDIRLVLVPGNHDCDFHRDNRAREIIIGRLDMGNLDNSIYSICTQVQNPFMEFSDGAGVEFDGNMPRCLCAKMVCRVGTSVIEFRLLNTAWMSTLEESQGALLFPVSELLDVEEKSDRPDLVVSMLHHPYNWFEASNGKELRRYIEATSDLVLTGHEHEGEHFRIVHDPDEEVSYLEGAVLQDTDERVSGFNVVMLDLDAQTQEITAFLWDTGERSYRREGNTSSWQFLRNRRRLGNEFVLRSEFQQYLSDPEIPLSHPEKKQLLLDDLFVYPDLRMINDESLDKNAVTVVRSERVSRFLAEQTRVLLVGAEKCGKTALAKTVFLDARRAGVVPLYLSGENLTSYREAVVRSAIRDAFGDIYQSPSFDIYQQRRANATTMVIVDDFDKCKANPRGRNRVLQVLEEEFDCVLVMGSEQLRLDSLMVRHEGDGDEDYALLDYLLCSILPFGHVRRADLIAKWFCLGRRFTHDQAELTRLCQHAERTVALLLGRNFVPAYPIFILVMLQQMEARTPLETAATSGSYGFLYESLLTLALAQASGLHESLDTQYNYLSELAYRIYRNRGRPLRDEDAREWHSNYCRQYSVILDFADILKGFQSASVLSEDGGRISFRLPYMYYYFVGRYFSQHLDEDQVRTSIRDMSERLNHTESANVLLFLSYLSKDPLVISSILDASKSLFEAYDSYDIGDNREFIRGLVKEVPQYVLDAEDSPEDNRRKILAREDEREDAVTEENGEGVDCLSDHVKLDRNLDEIFQVNVAFKTIQILGQILRNYPGSLKGDRKLEIAEECYSLGLRVMTFLFNGVESEQERLIPYLVDLLRSKHPNWDDQKLASEVRGFLYQLLRATAYVIVKQVSDSVGLDKLMVTFNDLVRDNEAVSYRLIDLSVRLDYHPQFPEYEVFELDRLASKGSFASHLLRDLVWHYFYIYETDYQLREKISARLDFVIRPGIAHSRAVKRPRR